MSPLDEGKSIRYTPRVAARVLGWLLAVVFVLSGVTKLIGMQQAVDGFREFGFPDWFRLLIGALETAGGIGLAFPSTAKLAAFGMLVIMAGAVWTLWSAGQGLAPPLVVAAFLAARIGLDRSAS